MKKSINNATINEILKLRTRYSDRDLKDAIDYLANSQHLSKSSKTSQLKRASKNTKTLCSTRKEPEISKVVADLKMLDQERFELLSRFDKSLRNGEIMISLDSIRGAGLAIDKEFNPGKSRKGAISKFMKLLVSIPVDDARKQINYILESERNSDDKDNAYSKLATFLIRGKAS